MGGRSSEASFQFVQYNRVAFLVGHCIGVIFALSGWNTAIGFGAYSVGVYYLPPYPLDAMNINILARRGDFFQDRFGGLTKVSLRMSYSV